MLFLRDCSDTAPSYGDDASDVPAHKLPYRLTQRLILETRNYLVRRNAYYESYRLIARAFPASKKLERQARDWELLSFQANIPRPQGVGTAVAKGVE